MFHQFLRPRNACAPPAAPPAAPARCAPLPINSRDGGSCAGSRPVGPRQGASFPILLWGGDASATGGEHRRRGDCGRPHRGRGPATAMRGMAVAPRDRDAASRSRRATAMRHGAARRRGSLFGAACRPPCGHSHRPSRRPCASSEPRSRARRSWAAAAPEPRSWARSWAPPCNAHPPPSRAGTGAGSGRERCGGAAKTARFALRRSLPSGGGGGGGGAGGGRRGGGAGAGGTCKLLQHDS